MGGGAPYGLYGRTPRASRALRPGGQEQRLAADGRVRSTDRYDAWGNQQAGSNTTDPYGYKAQVGYYRDAETGLYLCTWRYYDPKAVGWWICIGWTQAAWSTGRSTGDQ